MTPFARILCPVLGMLLAASVAAGANLQGTCDISFAGKSTLHGFSGNVHSQPFILEARSDSGAEDSLWDVEVVVPVDEMDTGNEARDENMRGMFEASTYPYIRGFARNVDPETLRPRERENGTVDGTLPFTLTIRDVEQPVVAAVTNWLEGERQLTFDMSFTVSLKAFDLKAPTALFFIRVADTVEVEVHVVATNP